jgi:hypothetical protein
MINRAVIGYEIEHGKKPIVISINKSKLMRELEGEFLANTSSVPPIMGMEVMGMHAVDHDDLLIIL